MILQRSRVIARQSDRKLYHVPFRHPSTHKEEGLACLINLLPLAV